VGSLAVTRPAGPEEPASRRERDRDPGTERPDVRTARSPAAHRLLASLPRCQAWASGWGSGGTGGVASRQHTAHSNTWFPVGREPAWDRAF